MSSKVVCITGATGGLGEGLVTAFASQGYHVLIHTHHNLEKARVLKQAVIDCGQEALIVQADIERQSEAKETIEHCLAAFGRLDVLINNAGIKRDAPLESMTEDAFDEVMRVNVKAVFNMIQHASVPMKEAHSGRIINISSGIALTGRENNINYAASKAALHGLTKSVAKELGPYDITVNIIAPGLIETPMTSYVTPAQKAAYIDTVPLRRLGRPEDVAHTALFLASDQAAFISNQIICVNGGLHSA